MNRKQRRAQGQQTKPPSGSKPALSGIIHAAAVRSAETLLEQEKWDQAADVYKGILKEDPSNLAALYNYGLLLASVHGSKALPEGLQRAAQCFDKYLSRKPDDADALAALAIVRAEQGRADEAQTLMQRARGHAPSAKTLEHMGSYYRNAGDMAASEECLAEAIRKNPNAVTAYYSLSNAKPFAADSKEFEALQGFLGREGGLSAKNRVLLHFMLGKSLLSHGEDERAFTHYATANRLKRASFPQYDIARTEQYAASLISLFDETLVNNFRGKTGRKDSRPIFIIGMPRSGSTLVDQILSSHPDVGSVGEAPYFAKSVPRIADMPALGQLSPDDSTAARKLVAALNPAFIDGVAGQYLSLLRQDAPGHARVVDKNLFNYLWVGLIRLALPDAKIIHCTRDPRDIGLSIWQLLFHADLPWAYDLGEMGRYYNAYEKVMAHWHKLFPGGIYEVNYETMVSNQEAETRKLLDYCGLTWDDRCLRFHETKRHVQTASHSQVRKPMYKDSMAKWKKYERYLAPLIAALEKK